MAELVFDGGEEFGGGAAVGGDEEEGVVAEAEIALRLEEDAAFPGAVADDGGGVVGVAQVNHDALVARAALVFGDVGELLQEFFVVLRIGGARPGVARGIDAGRAVEGVDFQAGVVGERGQAGVLRGVARLEEGVFDEAQARFFDGRDVEVGLRQQFTHAFGDGFDFAQFVQVAGGDDDAFHIEPEKRTGAAPCACLAFALLFSLLSLLCFI